MIMHGIDAEKASCPHLSSIGWGPKAGKYPKGNLA